MEHGGREVPGGYDAQGLSVRGSGFSRKETLSRERVRVKASCDAREVAEK